MRKISEYRQHAEECRAMARVSASRDHREQLLNMAATWDSLADARARQLDKVGVTDDNNGRS